MARCVLLFSGLSFMEDIDLDRPIYKFFSLKNLLDSLEENHLYFRDILKWSDVWEQPLRFINCTEKNEDVVFELTKNNLFKIFGTCFTEEYNTDAMWRIYSEGMKGICVETTPRKLLNSVLRYEFVVGAFLAKVVYFKEDELASKVFSKEVC